MSLHRKFHWPIQKQIMQLTKNIKIQVPIQMKTQIQTANITLCTSDRKTISNNFLSTQNSKELIRTYKNTVSRNTNIKSLPFSHTRTAIEETIKTPEVGVHKLQDRITNIFENL